ncbi:MAG: dihydroorotase [Gammaproteobacteria bacterium]|nr:dihydroorotase [Gammaproteobacteria bacterium]
MSSSAADILIKNGRIIDPANNIDQVADFYVQDGKVAGLGTKKPAKFNPEKTIDAGGHIVCPGLVDLCARLREPGAEYKANVKSETHAAARAGITMMCLPPDTDPVIDEPAVVELIQQRAKENHSAEVVTLGALTVQLAGKQLSEIAALKEAGCVGVSNALQPMQDNRILRHAMEYVLTNDMTLHVIALDHGLSAKGVAHLGETSSRLGLQGIPVSAETVAMAQYLALVEEVGVKTHFGRLSSARAVEMIADAKSRGLPVTADVAIHNLHLTDEAIAHFNSQAHVIPPLRSAYDRDALLAGLRTGIIDAICSDHQPHEPDAKLNPFPSTSPGISGIDTLLGLSLQLIDQMNLSLNQILRALSHAPADILGVAGGHLSIGAAANICIFDPQPTWQLTRETMYSAGKNTPFLNSELPGRVMHTLVAGQIVEALF